jgi:hypothetical protein
MTSSNGLRALGIEPALSPVGLEVALRQSGAYPSEFFLAPPSVIVDQGETIPCCVSCALSTCVEVLNPGWEQLSPLYHFYMFNLAEGLPSKFQDMTLDEGLNVLASSGICLHRYYDVAYTADEVRTVPAEEARADALTRVYPYDSNREVGGFALLADDGRVGVWKITVLGGRPILVGFYLTDQYGPRMKKLQGSLLPDQPHAVAVLGFREAESSFLVQDSRGSGFGLGGQWWMPYDIVESSVVEQAYAVGYPPA